MQALSTSRRDLFVLPLLAALPLALGDEVDAAPDPTMTIVKLPDQIQWTQSTADGRPPNVSASAPLFGNSSQPGIYYQLQKWFPGYMSGPHWYETDRLCVVISGVWWVASGDTFDPEDTVPAPAGTFIRRIAKTPHYDGVKSSGTEPAVIAICGIGPITAHHVEQGKPAWRKV
jgi:hypothetical protein